MRLTTASTAVSSATVSSIGVGWGSKWRCIAQKRHDFDDEPRPSRCVRHRTKKARRSTPVEVLGELLDDTRSAFTDQSSASSGKSSAAASSNLMPVRKRAIFSCNSRTILSTSTLTSFGSELASAASRARSCPLRRKTFRRNDSVAPAAGEGTGIRICSQLNSGDTCTPAPAGQTMPPCSRRNDRSPQAHFWDVKSEKADHTCSTSWLPQ
jgi:hypothetical protein